ncbi:MFS transporter [Propionibacteriaceae bacterium Y2011]|uniref:MFS transporter n=1 Tax=Microlunatus sp. Y2014 TaxID=3418488 RepID=UPI003B4F5FA0
MSAGSDGGTGSDGPDSPDVSDSPDVGSPGGTATVAPGHEAVFAEHPPKRRTLAWAMWDWGSAAFNAVITTFVFATYLTDVVAENGAPAGALSGTAWLGRTTAAAGVFIALLAPVLGQRADAGGRRKASLGLWTALTVLAMCAMFLVKDDRSYLWLGLLLLALGNIFMEIGAVSYNAMLQQVSTPKTVGRVSGFGWALGYVGGIFLLLILFVGLISPEVGWFGVTSEEGLRYRVVALVAAVWFALSAIPLFIFVPEVPRRPDAPKVGFVQSYRVLFRDVLELWRNDRNAVFFLGASALFRDGLAAVFTFGAVLAVTVYGLSTSDVLIFGVAANVVAAIGAFAGGQLEDRLGPKTIIVVSLIGLMATAIALLFVYSTAVFWVLGLILCLWVGPAQSSSRSFLAQVSPPGREGQMFGLYATTGRAVSFLSPALLAVFAQFGGDRLGILGIVIVLGLGLAALLLVHSPARGKARL